MKNVPLLGCKGCHGCQGSMIHALPGRILVWGTGVRAAGQEGRIGRKRGKEMMRAMGRLP